MTLLDRFAPTGFRTDHGVGGRVGHLPQTHAIHRTVHQLAVTVRHQCRVDDLGQIPVIRPAISHTTHCTEHLRDDGSIIPAQPVKFEVVQ